jgi:heptosyltransferase-3
MPPPSGKILITQARNLGDAVIGTGLINSLGKSFPDSEIHLFSRPTFKEVFRGNPYIHQHHSAHFPIGTAKQMSFGNAIGLLRQIIALRKYRFDLCINNTGDFRENFICWLTRPRKNVSVVWEEGHRLAAIFRPGLTGLLDQKVQIPKSVENIYDVQDEMAKALGCKFIEPARIFIEKPATRSATNRVIGIHPAASQESKLWPWERWRELIQILRRDGFLICLFCAPNEKETVESHLLSKLSPEGISLHVSKLDGFFLKLQEMNLLVGLDSFSVHAANALGVPSVILNGANDIVAWAPPTSKFIAKGEICPHFPCFNKAPCSQSPLPYQCMEVIEVGEVVQKIRLILGKGRTGTGFIQPDFEKQN